MSLPKIVSCTMQCSCKRKRESASRSADSSKRRAQVIASANIEIAQLPRQHSELPEGLQRRLYQLRRAQLGSSIHR